MTLHVTAEDRNQNQKDSSYTRSELAFVRLRLCIRTISTTLFCGVILFVLLSSIQRPYVATSSAPYYRLSPPPRAENVTTRLEVAELTVRSLPSAEHEEG